MLVGTRYYDGRRRMGKIIIRVSELRLIEENHEKNNKKNNIAIGVIID